MFFRLICLYFLMIRFYRFVMWTLIDFQGFYSLLPFVSKHKLQPCFLKNVFFADLFATLSNTFCWEGCDWSVDKEVLLSDEFMYFYLLLFNFFFLFVKEVTVWDCRRFFFNLFYFYYDESNSLCCIFLNVFRYFCQNWLICLESKENMHNWL
jgi:hypothetical protein